MLNLGIACLAMFVVTLSTQVAGAQPTKSCTASDADKPAVTETIQAMLDAGMSNDLAAFNKLLAPGFYAFDGGKRWEGDALVKLVIDMHKQGYKHVWSVTDPVVEVDCDTAWIAYQNKGSVTAPDGVKQDRAWLESAFLVKRDGHWLIRFFHSSRAE